MTDVSLTRKQKQNFQHLPFNIRLLLASSQALKAASTDGRVFEGIWGTHDHEEFGNDWLEGFSLDEEGRDRRPEIGE